MDWWGSLDKASHLSKIAYTALKSAQQKIDAVLVIEDVPPTVVHRSSRDDALSNTLTPAPSSPVAVVKTDVVCSTNASPKSITVRATSETSISGELVSKSYSLEAGANSKRQSPLGSSIETISLTSRTSLSKSCSEGDLSGFPSPSSYHVSPTQCTHNEPGEDVETNTTGSDIEVLSCSTFNNDELSRSRVTAGDLVHHQGEKTNSRKLDDRNSILVSFPYEIGPHVPTNSRFPNGHRRAVSQERRIDHRGRNEELSFAMQRLSKEYAENLHLLRIREAKILELSRENSQLRDVNSLLESNLKDGQSQIDLSKLNAEFSQRLSKTELQLRMITRERDQLKASLASRPRQDKSNLQGGVNEERLSKRLTELERALSEKTSQADELFKEGEVLSQKLMKTNNLVKKLRNNEKEAEKREQAYLSQLKQLNTALQSVQNELKTKAELAREQSGKIQHLSKVSHMQEKELENLKVQHLHLNSTIDEQKALVLQLTSELAERKRELESAQHLVEYNSRAAKDEDSLRDAYEALKQRLDVTKAELASVKANHDNLAGQWREERNYFQNQLAESASRAESLGVVATSTAQPLLSQLHETQALLARQTAMWEQTEQDLTYKLAEARHDIEISREAERSRLMQLKVLEDRNAELVRELSQLKADRQETCEALSRTKDLLQTSQENELNLTEQVKELRNELEQQASRTGELEGSLLTERHRYDAQVAENEKLRESMLRLVLETNATQKSMVESETSRSSKVNETSDLHTAIAPPISPSWTGSPGLSRTTGVQSTMEYMQSLLKLKDGECTQLRRELESLSRSKDALMAEFASISARAERYARLAGMQTASSSGTDPPVDQLEELQQRYDALLLTLGRVTEENSELRMDLADIKEMYKSQIDMLLRDPAKP